MGDVDTVHRRRDVGILDQPPVDLCPQRRRREPVDRGPRRQVGRLDADDLPEIGSRRRQGRLGGELGGLPAGEWGLGLGHVGLRHLADIEPGARLPQRLLSWTQAAIAL